MLPTLREGDRLLVRYDAVPRTGSLVVATFPDGTVTVKRAARRVGPRWWLSADNASEGIDSRHVGAVASYDVVAVVLARLWPAPRRF